MIILFTVVGVNSTDIKFKNLYDHQSVMYLNNICLAAFRFQSFRVIIESINKLFFVMHDHKQRSQNMEKHKTNCTCTTGNTAQVSRER